MKQKIQKNLDEENLQRLEVNVNQLSDEELAEVAKPLGDSDLADLYRVLDSDSASRLFTRLDKSQQTRLIETLDTPGLSELLNHLPPDDHVRLIDEHPAYTSDILRLLDQDKREHVLDVLGYPEESIGRWMTPQFVEVPPDWSVGRTLSHIREVKDHPETVSEIYVTDEDGRLLDVLPLRRLLQTDHEEILDSLVDKSFIEESPETDQEIAAQFMNDYGLDALPIVNENGILLGIVTMDDAAAVLEDESTEDFQRFGGADPLRRPYFHTPILTVAKKRVGWLLFLFLGGTLTSSVMSFYESQLSAVVALSYFVPLLIGTGGNAGAQTVSTIIRGMAVGEVAWRQIFQVIVKEFAVGLIMGIFLGAVGYLFAFYLWSVSMNLALVVACSLPVICTWSSVVAGVVPLLAERCSIDPAAISAPLITTLVDATGLVIYFWIASALLGL